MNSIIQSLRAGGSAGGKRKKKTSTRSDINDSFESLAQVLQDDFPDCQLDQLTQSLTRLASSQNAFKNLDGMAHEAYQRTNINGNEVDTSVAGRAQRSAARVAATAEALWACELVEILDLQLLSQTEEPSSSEEEESRLKESTQSTRKDENSKKAVDSLEENEEAASLSCNGNRIQILYNGKINKRNGGDESKEGKKGCISLGKSKLSVLVLYEEDYDRGAGLEHGSIMYFSCSDNHQSSPNNNNNKEKRGRFLVVLDDSISEDFVETLQILSQKPKRVKLSTGLIAGEVVSVQPQLYKAAGQVLQSIEPYLRDPNRSKAAIHFVGRSLAGGVASLAATILDGSIPMPKGKVSSDNANPSSSKRKSSTKRQNKKMEDEADIDVKEAAADAKKSESGEEDKDENDEGQENPIDPIMSEPLNGLGRARSSALSLGAPPSLSGNVVAAYCTSFIYGDDIVSRTTHETLDHLRGRVEKTVHGGFLGQNLGLVSDTLSLTMAGFKSHAHGSEGEEIKLSIPGKAYLVRPRRLGGACSIHEVGNLQKGGREALRANLLWQLNDILLSKSMWKHHDLESYIQGLDRVHLRSSSESDDSLL
ncbi:unnamed protein product [Cylindrotheca closterium]|uniref:Uncharacterized protein n=1 Tax=Cylindrotheca closterium TaxID=2856 RepID=A0AAD2JNI0_9STRA|nr:unnamed protein product [Cylindrotheca closterium]